MSTKNSKGGATKTPTAKLKKELDAIFSRFIRYRDNGQCYTCPKKDDPKRMQCGHFVPRQYMATRYDERNNHCQCYACNMLYNGQPSAYAEHLKKDFGEGIIAELENMRREIVKDYPYEAQIKHYSEALKLYTG